MVMMQARLVASDERRRTWRPFFDGMAAAAARPVRGAAVRGAGCHRLKTLRITRCRHCTLCDTDMPSTAATSEPRRVPCSLAGSTGMQPPTTSLQYCARYIWCVRLLRRDYRTRGSGPGAQRPRWDHVPFRRARARSPTLSGRGSVGRRLRVRSRLLRVEAGGALGGALLLPLLERVVPPERRVDHP